MQHATVAMQMQFGTLGMLGVTPVHLLVISRSHEAAEQTGNDVARY